MTPGTLARHLFARHPEFQIRQLTPRQCRHATVQESLDDLAARSGGLLTLHDAGRSLEGRSIRTVTCGSGPQRVLLWSQMHGD